MHKNLIVATTIFLSTFCVAQTTYIFSGEGDWNTVSNWENGRIPGTTVLSDDTVRITGTLTLNAETSIVNQGKIIVGSETAALSELLIYGELQNENSVDIQENGVITIEENGYLDNNGNVSCLNSVLTNRGRIKNKKVLTIAGTESQLINTRTIDITDAGSVTSSGRVENSGKIRVERMATLVSESEFIHSGEFDNEGTLEAKQGVTITDKGFLFNKNTLRIEDAEVTVNGRFENFGPGTLVELNSSTVTFTPGSEFSNGITGKINLSTTTLNMNEDVENEGDIDIDANSTLTVRSEKIFTNRRTVRNHGTLIALEGVFDNASGSFINNGTLQSAMDGSTFQNKGTITGTDATHNGSLVTERGTLSPGTAKEKATYIINGDVLLSKQARILIDVFSDSDADQVTVSENITLGGILNVKLSNEITDLSKGATFTVLEGASIRGQFEALRLPELPEGKDWEIEYEDSKVVLRVVGNQTLSTTDNELDSDAIRIAPNPVKSTFAIHGLRGTTDVEIYSITGQLVRNKVITNTSSVAIDGLSSGYYVVRVGNQRLRLIKE